MPNLFGAPELTPIEVEQKRKNGEQFVWLDVREAKEVLLARIDDPRIDFLPLSQLAAQQLQALPAAMADQETPVLVMCHHGIRSAQVVVWLQQHGWTNVYNLAGGIEAWSQRIDSSVGKY